MEANFAQVIDIPIDNIFNVLLTVAGGGIIYQFKSVMRRLDELTDKINIMQIDITKLNTWREFQERQEDRREE